LSTTSAATVIARCWTASPTVFITGDLLDLLKSPFALSDIEADQRRALTHELDA